TDFEEIHEVGIERQRQRNLDRPRTVIPDAKPIDACALAEDTGSQHVDRAMRQLDVPVAADVLIREIGDERDVVLADRGAEKKRLIPREKQHELREKSSPVMI